MTVNKTTLTEKEIDFLDMVATTTPIEKEFLELCLTTDDEGRNMIFTMVACTVAFGTEYLNEARPYVQSNDREVIIRVTEKYSERLKQK